MAALGSFEDCPRVAVAVSGGGDSLALLHLIQEWARGCGGETIALTVDHGLRAGSSLEALQVAAWCSALKCEHAILRWRDPPVDMAGLQAQARAARYRLLDDACRDRGILHLAVAHHRDDQAETILLRLAQGSGVDGLAGMAAITELDHVRLLRPLLKFSSATLKDICRARGQEWIEDPTNTALRFARPRLRSDVGLFAAHGLDSLALEHTAARMAAVRAMLERQTAVFLAREVAVEPGIARMGIAAVRGCAPELQSRVLGQLIRAIGDGDYLPRFAKLQAVRHAIAEPCFKRTTLGSCLLERRKHMLCITREQRTVAGREVQAATSSRHAAGKAIFAIV